MSKIELAILCAAIGVVLLLWVFAPWGRGTGNSAAVPTSALSHLRAGQEGHLDNGGDTAFVAADDAAFDELTKAASAGDQVGIRELVRGGRVFLVPQNTRILVIENGVFSVRIRVLDGLQKDKAGWVPAEFVKP